ncbi:septum site-determining protein MinC [Deinococcus arenicola]|uniref:Septum site-determining protein MinC n=1 Tax=Deinococcus arenicola TaxID=2994950 RepID=A0ABU4DND5_9DEIO|nr:septum site-determining protein MinC [Deinococcus sp. ZS9-10]MDV6373935.1 septum site-determining protein MinC [Deinococcus sp. ZS9-10]
MKLRGTLGGLNLLLEPGDTAESVSRGLHFPTLSGESVTIEIGGDADLSALEQTLELIREAGGQPGRIRAPRVTVASPAQPAAVHPADSARTVIVPHTIRAGSRNEYKGSVIVLGDVNPSAEVIAGGDVIVIGALRGIAHAGQGGYADAIVWARPIASTQIRIGDAVARAPEGSSLSNMRQRDGQPVAELARLQNGVIAIDVQK